MGGFCPKRGLRPTLSVEGVDLGELSGRGYVETPLPSAKAKHHAVTVASALSCT